MFNQKLEKQAQKVLSFLDNEYVSVSIKTFLAIYVAIWAPRLPKSFMDLFNNNLFKTLVFTTILVLSTKDIGLALMTSLAYIVSMMYLKKYVVMDNVMNNNENGNSDELDRIERELEEEQNKNIDNDDEDNDEDNDQDIKLQNPFENKINYENRRNNKVVYYQTNQVDYDNDTNTLTTHIYNSDAEEAPGFLENVDNNGINLSTGSNELDGTNNGDNNSDINSNVIEGFHNKKKTSKNNEENEDNVNNDEKNTEEQAEEQGYKEVVVGAPLHLDHEHNSPQGLNKLKGYEGPNIGSWFQY